MNLVDSSSVFPPVWLQQTRIGLSLFDVQGLGFLKETVSAARHPGSQQVLLFCQRYLPIVMVVPLLVYIVTVISLQNDYQLGGGGEWEGVVHAIGSYENCFYLFIERLDNL